MTLTPAKTFSTFTKFNVVNNTLSQSLAYNLSELNSSTRLFCHCYDEQTGLSISEINSLKPKPDFTSNSLVEKRAFVKYRLPVTAMIYLQVILNGSSKTLQYDVEKIITASTSNAFSLWDIKDVSGTSLKKYFENGVTIELHQPEFGGNLLFTFDTLELHHYKAHQLSFMLKVLPIMELANSEVILPPPHDDEELPPVDA